MDRAAPATRSASNAETERFSTTFSGAPQSARHTAKLPDVTVELVDQRSVTTWSRLLRAGCTPAYVKAQLAAQRWRRWGYAIVLHNGPLSAKERWYVARVHGGPGALLTAFTAAEAYGLRGWERERVHVLGKPGTRASARSPVPMRLHRVADWAQVRRHPRGPVHVLPQALLVAAASFDSPRPACGIVAAAVQQRLVTPARVRAALTQASCTRHRSILLHAVDDIAQGAQALSEIDFVRLCRRHGLPPPDQQLVRREPGGRRRYLDATWRRADGRLVVVEVDGAVHLDQRNWWSDQSRQNKLVLADAVVLRYPSVVIRTQPQLVAAEIREALRVP